MAKYREVSALALVAVFGLAACGGGDGQVSDESAGATNAAASTAAGAGGTGEGSSSENFTSDNWALLNSRPDDYKGASVDIVGKIFLPPERDADGVYFQMYADPANSQYNTVVAHRDTSITVSDGDFVHVVGKVAEALEGENAFGAELTLPRVIADTIELVDAAATKPALETLGKASYATNGLTFTVTAVEFAADETRVNLTMDNQSGADFNLYSFNMKALQNRAQFEPEFSSDYPELPSEIVNGAEASGVIVFPAMDPSKGLRLLMEGSSENTSIGEYGSIKWEFNWK